MILLIDNYDSFSHNLARYVRLLGAEVRIIQNDELALNEISALSPSAIILSPGPCAPAQSGICVDVVRNFGASIPLLGVCLGHQCINEAYGGKTVHAKMPLVAELVAESPLKVTATADDGTLMAFTHPTHPVYGVQFHPESILTEHGLRLLENFVKG